MYVPSGAGRSLLSPTKGAPLASLEPKDSVTLKKEFVSAREAAKKTLAAAREHPDGAKYSLELWPARMNDFLERRLGRLFIVRAYTLDPAKLEPPENGEARPQVLPVGSEALEIDPFKGLIRIDEIRAQRGLSDAGDQTAHRGENESDDRGEHRNKLRLSEQLQIYYRRHLDPSESPTPSDVAASRTTCTRWRTRPKPNTEKKKALRMTSLG